jgi:hypothetical protein
VIGLPDRIRLACFAPAHQVEQLLVPLGALVREHRQPRVDAADHRVHRGVRGHRPALVASDAGDLAVNGRNRRGRAPQRQALDQ